MIMQRAAPRRCSGWRSAAAGLRCTLNAARRAGGRGQLWGICCSACTSSSSARICRRAVERNTSSWPSWGGGMGDAGVGVENEGRRRQGIKQDNWIRQGARASTRCWLVGGHLSDCVYRLHRAPVHPLDPPTPLTLISKAFSSFMMFFVASLRRGAIDSASVRACRQSVACGAARRAGSGFCCMCICGGFPPPVQARNWGRQ